MKILLLCKRHYTNRDLIRHRFGRLYHLPVQLTKQGHQAEVIAADYRQSATRQTTMAGVTFHSLGLRPWQLAPYLLRCNKICHRLQPDIVIASSDVHFGLLGYFLARRKKIPFVFDIYDDYSAFASCRLPAIQGLYHYLLRRADLLVTNGPALSRHLRPYNSARIAIENGVDLNTFHPVAMARARTRLDIPAHDTVIGFFGSMDVNRGVETLLQAFHSMRQDIPNLRLLLAGHNGIDLDLKVSGIDYRGLVDQATVNLLINACNVAVIPYLPDQQVNLSNACKIAEYLACQVPMVATAVADHATLFQDAPHGLCQPGDADDMQRAIRAQLQERTILPFPERLRWENLGENLLAGLYRLV